jgi:hypothetical protein
MHHSVLEEQRGLLNQSLATRGGNHSALCNRIKSSSGAMNDMRERLWEAVERFNVTQEQKCWGFGKVMEAGAKGCKRR